MSSHTTLELLERKLRAVKWPVSIIRKSRQSTTVDMKTWLQATYSDSGKGSPLMAKQSRWLKDTSSGRVPREDHHFRCPCSDRSQESTHQKRSLMRQRAAGRRLLSQQPR